MFSNLRQLEKKVTFELKNLIQRRLIVWNVGSTYRNPNIIQISFKLQKSERFKFKAGKL